MGDFETHTTTRPANPESSFGPLASRPHTKAIWEEGGEIDSCIWLEGLMHDEVVELFSNIYIG